MVQIGTGLLLCAAAWLALRVSVGAPLLGRPGSGRFGAIALDAFPPLAAFGLTFAALGRPILAGLAVVAPAIGLIVVDRVKRVVLDEPVMFADRAELFEVVRHPRLYIPFVGVLPMTLGTIAIAVLLVALVRLEPPLWHVPPVAWLGSAIAALVIARLLFVMPTWPPLLERLAAAYRRWNPPRDPAGDAQAFGMLAGFVVEATLARAERPLRRMQVREPALPSWGAGAGPVIVVQGESFTLADRLAPALSGAAPNFLRLAGEAVQAGRFAVPAWGANTIRTEFEVLTGIDTRRLGLDRFNPYEAFARAPIASLASEARAAGRRTICLHPYARHFYGRDKVMPALGFDQFIGIEAFSGAPRNGSYVTDVALAERIATLVAEHGSNLFLFAMSMENHGPWNGGNDEEAVLPSSIAALPQGPAFARWLARLRRTDAMLPVLERALAGSGGWLALYGDHQPSFPGLFSELGVHDRDTDYLIWQEGRVGRALAVSLAAYDFAPTLLNLMRGDQPRR